MDIVTMAMAKPKVIKLQDFDDASGESLNNKALISLQTSLGNGGAWQLCTFVGGDTARFFDSVKYGGQYAFEFSILGTPMIMSATLTFDGLSANQIVMRGAAFYVEGINEFTIIILRQSTNEALVYVKGTTVT